VLTSITGTGDLNLREEKNLLKNKMNSRMRKFEKIGRTSQENQPMEEK
jgi:hypothetical protein